MEGSFPAEHQSITLPLPADLLPLVPLGARCFPGKWEICTVYPPVIKENMTHQFRPPSSTLLLLFGPVLRLMLVLSAVTGSAWPLWLVCCPKHKKLWGSVYSDSFLPQPAWTSSVIWLTEAHLCHRWQQDQQTDLQGWKYQGPESGGVWVPQGQEVTEQSALQRQQNSFSLKSPHTLLFQSFFLLLLRFIIYMSFMEADTVC